MDYTLCINTARSSISRFLKDPYGICTSHRFATVQQCDIHKDGRTDAFAIATTGLLHGKLCWRRMKMKDQDCLHYC